MSPEQLIGNGIDLRSDLWSFSVIMYQMLSGRLPFNVGHDQKQIYAILNEAPAPLVRAGKPIPEKINEIVSKNLQKEPDRRYLQAADIIRELETGCSVEFSLIEKRQAKKQISGHFVFSIIFGLISVAVFLLLYPFTGKEDQTVKIAVMPFADLSPNVRETYFSTGVSNEILCEVAKINGIRVFAQQSIEYLQSMAMSLKEIAEKLEADYVLNGKIMRSNGRIQLNVQLIDTEDYKVKWASTYDRALTDLLAIQDDIAREIAIALKANLTMKKKKYITRESELNPSAYDYYLRGYQYYMRDDNENSEISIQLFRKAIQIDSGFAPAYAGLSWAYTNRAVPFRSDYTYYDSALVMARKARELDNNCPEAYLALGMLKSRCGTYSQASYIEACEAYSRAQGLMNLYQD